MNTPCGYGRPSWFERSNRHDRLRYHFQATALGVEVHRVSLRSSTGVGGIRTSIHYYNTEEDIDALLAGIRDFLEQEK